MLGIIQSWRKKNSSQKNLLSFLSEMEKNLETYYVMDQRQFIVHGFQMDKSNSVKDLEIIRNNKDIQLYLESLNNFNNAYQEYKSYEKWYTSDENNKNNENARKLHSLKDSLQTRIKNYEAIIVQAGQSLERELLKLGFITN